MKRAVSCSTMCMAAGNSLSRCRAVPPAGRLEIVDRVQDIRRAARRWPARSRAARPGRGSPAAARSRKASTAANCSRVTIGSPAAGGADDQVGGGQRLGQLVPRPGLAVPAMGQFDRPIEMPIDDRHPPDAFVLQVAQAFLRPSRRRRSPAPACRRSARRPAGRNRPPPRWRRSRAAGGWPSRWPRAAPRGAPPETPRAAAARCCPAPWPPGRPPSPGRGFAARPSTMLSRLEATVNKCRTAASSLYW